MTGPEPVEKEARRWLRFSAEDLDAASRLMTGEATSPRHACWLSQQAAEKALKAALILEGVDYPLTHDLDALRNLLPSKWAVRRTHNALAELTEWAIESRYPGDWPEPADDDAERSLALARSLYDSIAAEIMTREG